MEGPNNQVNELKRTLSKYITPHMVVFSTDKVKKMFNKYNLTPAEFLRPFGSYNGITYYDPFPNDNNYNTVEITDLRIEFYDAESMHGFENAHQVISEIFDKHKPQIALEELDWSKKENIEAIQQLDPRSNCTEWYKKWEECFLDTCKFASHEIIDQPLMFFFLVSAEDTDINKELKNLQSMKSTIKRYGEKTYDPDFPHIFLLLHNTSGSITHDMATLTYEKMQKKYAVGFNQVGLWSMDFSPSQGTGFDDWEKYLRMNRIQKYDVLEGWDRKNLLSIDEREQCRYYIKELIDTKLINIIASKIRNFEHIVKNTKKGFANAVKSFWKPKERSENDGLRKDFVMNSQEVAMKSLIDISFIFQDYRTFGNYLKYPMNDFKSIKAYRHSSSCIELQFFSYMLSSYSNYIDSREFQQSIFAAANSYSRAKDPKWMIRNLIITADLCKTIGKYEEAARAYLRIAYSFSNSSWIPAIFFEQAAYCYLKIDQQRKFTFYIVKAGIVYEKYEYKTHSFYCFGISEPYYTKFKWNQIRNFLYTSLSQSSFYFGNLQLSVKFFRNLLQLCCDMEDNSDVQASQKECLNQFFEVVQNWNECRKKKESELLAIEDGIQESVINIGFLSLPKFLDDLLEVMLPHELDISQQNDSNSNTSWRMIIRQAMSYIEEQEEKHAKETPGLVDLYQLTRDEKFEIGLFEAANRFEKKTDALKKVRKVYAKEPIIVKVFVKNPLMTDVEISKIFLKCKFVPKENKSEESEEFKVEEKVEDFTINEQKVILSPTSIKEIVLEVTPMREGEIFILGIEWVLFNAVSCNYYFPTHYPHDDANDENTSRKLKGKENMFHYEILPSSANLQVFFDEKLTKMFYYTEYTDIEVTFLNESDHSIKDVYLKCSHPVFFGFSCMKIIDEIPPQQQISKKLWFRAVGYLGTQNVKFVARYRVDKEKGGHARMTRAVKEINITKSFNFTISTANSEEEVRERILGVHVRDFNKIIDKESRKYMQINQLAFVKGTNNWSIAVKDHQTRKSKHGVEKFFSIEPLGNDYEPPFGDATGRRRGSSLLLEKGNQYEEIDFETPPYSDFIEHEYKYFKHIMKSLKEYTNRQLETASIAISWRIFKEGICDLRGFQCIFDIVLNNQIVSNHENIDKEEEIDNPLVCLANYEKIKEFDFSKNQFCNLPLSLTITNVLKSKPVSFCIEAESEKKVRNINDYFWTGVTRKNIKTLRPNEVMDIEFTACFTTPGVYDLNKIKLILFKDQTTGQLCETFEERKSCKKLQEIPKCLKYKNLIVKIE